MLNFNIIRLSRLNSTKLIRTASLSTKSGTNTSSTSSTSSNSDDERKIESKKRSEEARQKLNVLLMKMIQEDSTANKNQDSKLELTKAKDHRRRAKKVNLDAESMKQEPIQKQAIQVAKQVAQTLGGDVKQTESELLQKLLNPTKEETNQTSSASLSDLFKDMQIDRETKTDASTSRAEQVRQLLQSFKKDQVVTRPKTFRKTRPLQQAIEVDIADELIDLHVSERLQIFNIDEVQTWENPAVNKTWKALQERELELAVTHPPANYFQQMILWTKQGKVWRFPIDNEQDIEEDQKVYFTEHIFLEKHLEGWCPSKGPIRHFMEIVCVALSKNPYLTVEMKKDHINWFRDYFRDKKQLLHEVGAIPPGFDLGTDNLKLESKK